MLSHLVIAGNQHRSLKERRLVGEIQQQPDSVIMMWVLVRLEWVMVGI
jgi:hypothetical protein